MTGFDQTCGGPWLKPTEIVELTATQRWSLQCQRLETMDISYLPNVAGRLTVERKALLKYPQGRKTARQKTALRWEQKSQATLDLSAVLVLADSTY